MSETCDRCGSVIGQPAAPIMTRDGLWKYCQPCAKIIGKLGDEWVSCYDWPPATAGDAQEMLAEEPLEPERPKEDFSQSLNRAAEKFLVANGEPSGQEARQLAMRRAASAAGREHNKRRKPRKKETAPPAPTMTWTEAKAAAAEMARQKKARL